jgi:hypothetical protein
MRVRRFVSFAAALLLGAAAAGLVACGDRSDLIPSDDASRLKERIAAVRAAMEAGDCQRAIAEAGAVQAQARLLPDDVDPRLRRRVRSGANALATEVPEDCQARTETVETTPETATTETTETVPPTVTETVPAPTVTETTPTTTQETVPPETGGATPEEEQ